MLNTTGEYNFIDISFLLPINSDDTVLLIGENEFLAEGLSKVCKRVIKKTISSNLKEKGLSLPPRYLSGAEGSVDLIIFDDFKKARLKDKSHYIYSILHPVAPIQWMGHCILKDGGYICLFAFNLWRGGYSYKNLKRNLVNAGFEDIEIYIPIPTHKNPKFILTTNDRSPLIYYLSHHYERDSLYKNLIYLFIRLSSAVGVFNYIAPSYIITARYRKR